jgi:hypothetical protein
MFWLSEMFKNVLERRNVFKSNGFWKRKSKCYEAKCLKKWWFWAKNL